MFFGIFSSVIPYLIAAGFYLVWLLFSFLQPLLQKDVMEETEQELNIVNVEDNSLAKPEVKTFDYNTYRNQNKVTKSLQKFSFHLTDIPLLFRQKIIYPRDNNFVFHREIYLTNLFSRPPPVC